MNATDLEQRAAIVLLERERAALWASVTGHEYVDQDGHESIRLDGITPADIERVAAINARLARLRR